MTPKTKSNEQKKVEEVHLQEQFHRQEEDHPLPAREVLTEQKDKRASNEAPRLFVP